MLALLAQAEFVRPPIDWHAAAPELTLLAFGALLTMMDIGWLERGRKTAAPLAPIALLATMIPILTMFFNVLAMVAAYYIAVHGLQVEPGSYMRGIRTYLTPRDITIGVTKSAIFGLTIPLVACYRGYTASGGARGVGMATTQAVVTNFIAIFVLDYCVTIVAFAR